MKKVLLIFTFILIFFVILFWLAWMISVENFPENQGVWAIFFFLLKMFGPFVIISFLIMIANYLTEKIDNSGKKDFNSGEKSEFGKKSL